MGCGASTGVAEVVEPPMSLDAISSVVAPSTSGPSASSVSSFAAPRSMRSVTAPSVATSRRTASSLSSRPPVLLGSMTSEQRQVLQGAELTTPEQRAFRSLMVSGDNGKSSVPCSDGTFKKMRLRMWLDGEVSLGLPVADNAESDEYADGGYRRVTAEGVSTNHNIYLKLEYSGLIEARAALFGGENSENTGRPSQNPGVSSPLSGSFVLSPTHSSYRLNPSLNVGVSSLSFSSRSFSSITSPKAPQLLPSGHPSRRHTGSGSRAGLHRRRLLDTY